MTGKSISQEKRTQNSEQEKAEQRNVCDRYRTREPSSRCPVSVSTCGSMPKKGKPPAPGFMGSAPAQHKAPSVTKGHRERTSSRLTRERGDHDTAPAQSARSAAKSQTPSQLPARSRFSLPVGVNNRPLAAPDHLRGNDRLNRCDACTRIAPPRSTTSRPRD